MNPMLKNVLLVLQVVLSALQPTNVLPIWKHALLRVLVNSVMRVMSLKAANASNVLTLTKIVYHVNKIPYQSVQSVKQDTILLMMFAPNVQIVVWLVWVPALVQNATMVIIYWWLTKVRLVHVPPAILTVGLVLTPQILAPLARANSPYTDPNVLTTIRSLSKWSSKPTS